MPIRRRRLIILILVGGVIHHRITLFDIDPTSNEDVEYYDEEVNYNDLTGDQQKSVDCMLEMLNA